MTAGLLVRDANNNPVFDTATRMFRKIAVVAYSTANGSATFQRQAQDTALVPVARGWYQPVFTVNPNTNVVSWDYTNIPSQYRLGGSVEIWAQ